MNWNDIIILVKELLNKKFDMIHNGNFLSEDVYTLIRLIKKELITPDNFDPITTFRCQFKYHSSSAMKILFNIIYNHNTTNITVDAFDGNIICLPSTQMSDQDLFSFTLTHGRPPNIISTSIDKLMDKINELE